MLKYLKDKEFQIKIQPVSFSHANLRLMKEQIFRELLGGVATPYSHALKWKVHVNTTWLYFAV